MEGGWPKSRHCKGGCIILVLEMISPRDKKLKQFQTSFMDASLPLSTSFQSEMEMRGETSHYLFFPFQCQFTPGTHEKEKFVSRPLKIPCQRTTAKNKKDVIA